MEAGPLAPAPVLRSCPPVAGGQEPTAGGRPVVLDPAELARAAALATGPRAVFEAGRRALREFAADLLGVPPSDLTTNYSCPRCGTGPQLSHGRPGYTRNGRQVPLALSLSRSSGWILLGAVVAPPAGLRMGVDLADPAGMDFAGFDGVALTPGERTALAGLAGPALLRERARLWARKEAWLKMTGDGLATPPETLEILYRPEIRDLCAGEVGLPPDFCAAVAVSRSRPVTNGR